MNPENKFHTNENARLWAVIILAAVFYGMLVHDVSAAVFHVDPANGSMEGDGSPDSCWSTLQDVFDNDKIETRLYETKPWDGGSGLVVKNAGAPVKAGDTLLLYSGYHGAVFAAEYYNEDYIVIMAAEGQKPEVSYIHLRSVCRWIVQGLTISPSLGSDFGRNTLVNFENHGWTGPSYDCTVQYCTGYTVPDASAWTREQWDTLSCSAVSLPGSRMTARGNQFRNINFGISSSGDSALVEYNTIENFAGDGLRGLGNYSTFQYNTVKNCYAVNDNHDDGFQSWSNGAGGVGTGVVKGLVLRGNTIIGYTDPAQPFRGTLQGIGCFDGWFEDWLVENNVVVTDHWHGITLLGARGCIIRNNTVADVNEESPGPPWISIAAHKDGTPSSGCQVRNNLTTDLNLDPEVSEDHNVILDNYSDFFADYAGRDFHLLAGCAAVDAGSSDQAPAIDKDGRARPWGNEVDAGAYEYFDPTGISRPAVPEMLPVLRMTLCPGNGVCLQLGAAGYLEFDVYKQTGRKLLTMERGWYPAGTVHLPLVQPEGSRLSAGTYNIRIRSGAVSAWGRAAVGQ